MTPPSPTPRAVAALSLALSLLPPPPARAWSGNGHRTVGLIAQTLLQNGADSGDAASRATLDAIGGLLGSGFSLGELAPCADEIRSLDEFGGQKHSPGDTVQCGGLDLTVDPLSEPWHFVNVPITKPVAAGSVNDSCANGNCVVAQIRADVAVLKDPAADPAAKKTALMFLVHFVGDEHQPLHCATEIIGTQDDRGGNGKQVRFDGLTMNMHALWDHLIQKSDNLNNPDQLSRQLAGSLPPDGGSAWTQGDFIMDAAVESLRISEETVYPAYYAVADGGSSATASGGAKDKAKASARGPAVALPSDYASVMQPITYQRLQMAGVRLAALLKQALGGGTPGVARAAAAARGRARAPIDAAAP